MAKIKLGSVRIRMYEEIEQYMSGINIGTGGLSLGQNYDGINNSTFMALAGRDQWKSINWSINEQRMLSTNSVTNNNELFFVAKANSSNPKQICFIDQTTSTPLRAVIPINITVGAKDVAIPINEIKIEIKGDGQ